MIRLGSRNLEGEPSQVARASADAEGHLGHSLCREARDEAVAQATRKDREEVECSEAGLCGYCRLPSCICDCLPGRGGHAPALSLEGVSQMAYILPERLPALVRPAFDLVLRRIRSLKRCVQA